MPRCAAKFAFLVSIMCAIGCGAVTVCRAEAEAGVGAVLDEANIVTAPGQAQPFVYTFTTATTAPLTITLTDLETPAAFQSLSVAVTLGTTLVGSANVNASTGVATLDIPGAAGTYQVAIVGTPATQAYGSFGSFDVCTALQASPTTCIAADSTQGNIQAPSTVSTTGQAVLNTSFTSTVAGTYQVTLVDDTFPAALSSLVGGITQGSTSIAGPITGSATPTPTAVTLAAATPYSLLVEAMANGPNLAGLYSLLITDPTGATILARTLPVGELTAATNVSNPSLQALSLTVTDLDYPQALVSVGAAVTSGATLLGEITTSGTTNVTAASGSLQLWQYANSGTGTGAYNLTLTPSVPNTASLYSATPVVNAVSAATANTFAFAATIPSAGTYHLGVTDFQFPTSLATLTSTLAQNGTALQVDASGNFTATAGPVIVVVNAVAAQSSIGIFNVAIATTGSSPSLLLDQTQSVGSGFSSSTLEFGVSGSFDVNLVDLGFPASFENLAVVVSQGATVVGKIYGAGNFSFPATPGKYVFSYVQTPGAAGYGLFGIDVSPSPPTVTLTASTTTVPAGQSVQLVWTTTNATGCSASGATDWSGNEPLSSTGVAVTVSAPVTLTLTCTGAGGSGSASVSVTTTPAATGQGGGALGLNELAWLGMLGVLRAARSRTRRESIRYRRTRG